MADSSTSTDSDSYDYYAYDPSMVAAVIFIVLFGAVSLLHTYQLFRTRTWYFIPFLIGGYCELGCPLRKCLKLTFPKFKRSDMSEYVLGSLPVLTR